MSTLATTNLKHASSGSNNIVLASDGTTTIAAPSNIIKSGTAVASTSGTSIDFTGIPSWVKRITVMLSGVSTNGTSNAPLLQIGDSGGVETSSYTGTVAYLGSSTNATANSSGFLMNLGVADGTVTTGIATLSLISGNLWVFSWVGTYENSSFTAVGAGRKTLSDTLDRVRITTTNGTDAFDAGTVNILYEG